MDQTSLQRKIRTHFSPVANLRQLECCGDARNNLQGRRKYIFTDQIDQLIREIYLSQRDARTRMGIRPLARKVGMPHWALKRRARELGLARTKELPWSEPELAILARYAWMTDERIRLKLKAKLARNLGLPKLTFQVIRRTIATLAQKKGTVKDVQGLLRHSRAATTTDVYMQEIPESVRATVNAIHQELRVKPENLGAN